jgi:aspartate/methionine/tyrosine aminotransferase
MAQSYSARSRAIEPFHVMALLARANELQAVGHDVIHLEIGEPDFTTAEPIIRAGQAALEAGRTRYTAARGIPELREAISGFYQQRYGLNIDPRRILITPGGSGALLLSSALLVDPGKTLVAGGPGLPLQPALFAFGRRRCAVGAGRPGRSLSADTGLDRAALGSRQRRSAGGITGQSDGDDPDSG